VRIDRNNLILQWPDQTRSKGKIIRREAVFPDQPQPAQSPKPLDGSSALLMSVVGVYRQLRASF
jgi:hypothetical protein